MSPIRQVFRMIWRQERAAMLRGFVLSVTVLLAGAALLGLSGWFITAAGAAGLAGIGIAFDVFRPSAGVRLLALGRTAARYGERLLTHDATLRALARLRVQLLERLSRTDTSTLARLRSPALLNRVTADVDALDGVAIRLVFPLLAGAGTLLGAALLLAWLVAPIVAAVTILSLLGSAVIATLVIGRTAIGPAAAAEAAKQGLRAGAVEHLRARTALAFAGALPLHRDQVLSHDRHARQAQRRLARLDRRAAAVASMGSMIAATLAMAIGGALAMAGTILPAQAAIAVFAALAMAEVLAPLQRGVAEIGRMRDSAQRVADALEANPVPPQTLSQRVEIRGLKLSEVSVAAPGSLAPLFAPVSLSVAAGETVALVGRSGLGKSTLLSAIAGLSPLLSGAIASNDVDLGDLPEPTLRAHLGVLPQSTRLLSGTLRSNLTLAAPEAGDAEMLAVLRMLGLDPILEARGGLDMILGEGGSGLSGGEARRVALARVLLRHPSILLMDEPTEGLDAESATRVLDAVRRYLPDAAILMTTHRDGDKAACDRWLSLKSIS